MKIKITGDSTCDLSPELVEKYNIGILPLFVSIGEKNGLDGVSIATDEIFDYYAENKVLPRTGSRSAEDFETFFRSFTEQGYTVIHYNISDSMSSSHSNACLAAERVGNVFVVDSCSLSTGTALLMLDACDMASKGMSVEQIVARSVRRAKNVQASFIIDNLEFLHKGGRCSALAYYSANLLQIKPSIEVKDGKMGVAKKYMGRFSRCALKYAKDVKETYTTPDKTRCFVTHSQMDEKVLENIVAEVKSWNIFNEVLVTAAGATVSTHCGYNTIGVLFMNDGESAER